MNRAAVRTVADFIAVNAVQPGTIGIGAIRIGVGKRRRVAARVPFLAARRAAVTADARVEVDDEAEFALRMGGKAGHRRALLNSAP